MNKRQARVGQIRGGEPLARSDRCAYSGPCHWGSPPIALGCDDHLLPCDLLLNDKQKSGKQGLEFVVQQGIPHRAGPASFPEWVAAQSRPARAQAEVCLQRGDSCRNSWPLELETGPLCRTGPPRGHESRKQRPVHLKPSGLDCRAQMWAWKLMQVKEGTSDLGACGTLRIALV